MDTTQLRLGRDLARWACVILILATILALIYPVLVSRYCFEGGFWPPECFLFLSYPFAQYSTALFLDAALFYVIARVTDRFLHARLEVTKIQDLGG